jgi:hypothetical protein
MNMVTKTRMIVENKPIFFQAVTLGYLLIMTLLKWQIRLTLTTAYFVVGGIIGLYLIDIAEAFVELRPSPFRTWLFCYGFIIVSLFVVTSSGSYLASGLVLSMFITLIIWMGGQLHLTANTDSWYQMLKSPAPRRNQGIQYGVFILIFLLETFLFLRQMPA